MIYSITANDGELQMAESFSCKELHDRDRTEIKDRISVAINKGENAQSQVVQWVKLI
ncbi:MAG: hypothetical protein OXD01_01850 [Gammaproteobacteria bacterium]|nr:hypothetical protein [Gammaproteobacteria bacterium]